VTKSQPTKQQLKPLSDKKSAKLSAEDREAVLKEVRAHLQAVERRKAN